LIVECIAETLQGLDDSWLSESSGWDSSTELRLTIGKQYVVFGLTTFTGGMWYYIVDDANLPYPVWHPAAVFTLVSGDLPSDWVVGQHRYPSGNVDTVVSFPEWAGDPYFYDRLTDGHDLEAQLFYKVKTELESRYLPKEQPEH
jgi:hypothetical protein